MDRSQLLVWLSMARVMAKMVQSGEENFWLQITNPISGHFTWDISLCRAVMQPLNSLPAPRWLCFGHWGLNGMNASRLYVSFVQRIEHSYLLNWKRRSIRFPHPAWAGC